MPIAPPGEPWHKDARWPAPKNAWPWPFQGSKTTGFLAEPWGTQDISTSDGVLRVRGNSRLFLVEDYTAGHWDHHRYVRFDLRGKTLSFTADVSRVQCNCDGALYLSHMDPPSAERSSNYCGIMTDDARQDGEPCLEIDLMEASAKAFHTALHTTRGRVAGDGTCNDFGCTVNVGNRSLTRSGVPASEVYGRGAAGIDTRHPFRVYASFDSAAALNLRLEQDGRTLPFFNTSSASNPNAAFDGPPPSGVPDAAIKHTARAMEHGMVLVVSLWGGFPGLQTWLNGQCSPEYTTCDRTTLNAENELRIWDMVLAPNAPPAQAKLPDSSPPPPRPPPQPELWAQTPRARWHPTLQVAVLLFVGVAALAYTFRWHAERCARCRGHRSRRRRLSEEDVPTLWQEAELGPMGGAAHTGLEATSDGAARK